MIPLLRALDWILDRVTVLLLTVLLLVVGAQIFAIIKAVNGQRLRIPMLTEMAEKM